MKKLILSIIILLASVGSQAASVVGVGTAGASGVIGGSNSASLSATLAGVRTGAVSVATPFGAYGNSVTITTAIGGNVSSPNADGGFAAGAIGGSGAGGFNSGNASTNLPILIPVPFN